MRCKRGKKGGGLLILGINRWLQKEIEGEMEVEEGGSLISLGNFNVRTKLLEYEKKEFYNGKMILNWIIVKWLTLMNQE